METSCRVRGGQSAAVRSDGIACFPMLYLAVRGRIAGCRDSGKSAGGVVDLGSFGTGDVSRLDVRRWGHAMPNPASAESYPHCVPHGGAVTQHQLADVLYSASVATM